DDSAVELASGTPCPRPDRVDLSCLTCSLCAVITAVVAAIPAIRGAVGRGVRRRTSPRGSGGPAGSEVPMRDVPSNIREAKRRIEHELLSRPGVTGVDIGVKEVGGRPTGELAIRVLVDKKK